MTGLGHDWVSPEQGALALFIVCVLSNGVNWLALHSEHGLYTGSLAVASLHLSESVPIAEALAGPAGCHLAP